MTENTAFSCTISAQTEVPTSAPNNVTLNDDELRNAVPLWINNKNEVDAKCGHISEWNTSLATDMRWLFDSTIKTGAK